MKFVHGMIMASMVVFAGWALLWALGEFFDVRSMRRHQHEKTCRDGRVAFFMECQTTTARPLCEVLWSEKRGHVFDARPENEFASGIDCSDQIE